MTKYIGPKTDGENVATQADKLSLSSEAPDALTPDQTGAAGTATTAARSDHQHEILAGAAGTITPDAASAEGSSSSFARADHTHAIVAAAAGTIQPDDAAAEGSSTSFARADHTHAIVAAAAGTITGTNAEGSSTSFARADHDHAVKAVGAFYAYRNNNQTGLGNAASTQVHFDAELFDVSGWFAITGTTGNNGTQGRFTPQLAGYYRFSAFLSTSVSGNTYLDFCKNNTTFFEVGAESAIQRVFGTCLIEMNGTTDYVDLRIFNGTGNTLTINSGAQKSYFCGEYVGAA